jgi:exocyst complex component 4
LQISPNQLIFILFHLHSDSNNIDSFGNFLDDFAVNIFLPQIEDKVMQLIQNATVGKCGSFVSSNHSVPLSHGFPVFIGADAFRDDDNYQKLSRHPVIRVRAVALD